MPKLTAMTTRKKIILILLIAIILVIIWQIATLFRASGKEGESSATIHSTASSKSVTTTATSTPRDQSPTTPHPVAQANSGAALNRSQIAAQPASMAGQSPTPPQFSARELELMRIQQETQARYIQAQNELQLLKIQRDIAEANKAIATARLDAVTAEKQIVNLLAPSALPTGLIQNTAVSPTAAAAPEVPSAVPGPSSPEAAAYTVVSVSRLQGRWSAVLSYHGSLYNVYEGDVLSTDGSVVVSIRREGIILRKDGVRKKVSLVPIV